MPIILQKRITRSDLRANPDKFFVFGDNVRRSGFGGQAKEMRGEPNAIGVVTKWGPSMAEGAFFSDTTTCHTLVERDLRSIAHLVDRGETVVVPEDGIGTGMAQLATRAPKLLALINDFFNAGVAKR